MKKTNLDIINAAYMQCFPEQGAEVKGELELIQEINQTNALINRQKSQYIDLALAVAYVKALGNHVNFLSSQGVAFPDATKNFNQLIQTFLLKHDPAVTVPAEEFKSTQPTMDRESKPSRSRVPSADSDISSTSPFLYEDKDYQPLPVDRESQTRLEGKYDKPELKQAPVIVNNSLAARGAEFRINAKNDLPALKKLGFFAETTNEVNKMAYVLLTEGYKDSPIRGRQESWTKNDFALAQKLQDEEFGRYFKR